MFIQMERLEICVVLSRHIFRLCQLRVVILLKANGKVAVNSPLQGSKVTGRRCVRVRIENRRSPSCVSKRSTDCLGSASRDGR